MVKNSGRQQHLYQVFGGLGRRERTQQESDYPYEGLLVRTVLSYTGEPGLVECSHHPLNDRIVSMCLNCLKKPYGLC